MKKILLSFVLFSVFSSAQVTTFPWTENFEDSSPTQSQWVCEYVAGTNTSVTSGLFWSIKSTTSVGYYSSTGAYQGSKMAVFDTRSHTRDGVARFISPVLNLSSATAPKLDFFYRNQIWTTDQNELKIYYRTSATAPWTLITTFNSNVPSWINSGAITLPNPSATYQIALEGVAKYGYGLDVDLLKVENGTLAVEEVSAVVKDVKIFPNPTSDVLNVESKEVISRYSISDYGGKNLKTEVVNSKELKIDVRDLSSGGYIIVLEDKSGNKSSQKFIKK